MGEESQKPLVHDNTNKKAESQYKIIMSKYYSVQTNNRFANLNLDSEEETILSGKPEHIIKAEEAKANEKAADEKNNKLQKKNNMKGGNNSKISDNKKLGGQSPVRGGRDYEAQADNRGKDRERNTRRAEDSQRKKFEGKRDGKKQLDKRGEFSKARAPAEDVDPKHVQEDKEDAENDVKVEAEESSVEKSVETKEKVAGISVQEYNGQLAADRYQVPEALTPQKFDDLEKDLNQAGMTQKIKAEQDVCQPMGKKVDRANKVKATAVSIGDLGRVPKLSRSFENNRPQKADYKSNSINVENDSPKKQFSKKAYKDDSIFPGLE